MSSNRFFQIIQKIFKRSKQAHIYKGKDLYGNIFYEIEMGPDSKNKRFYIPREKWEFKMSPEWQSWLRHTRKEPPTEDEINRNYQLSQIKNIKSSLKEELKESNKAKLDKNSST